jgi:predicted transglutaminase-like protease
MKNIKDVAKVLAKHEGLKKQVDIAQISELLRLLSTLCYDYPETIAILITNGQKDAPKRGC